MKILHRLATTLASLILIGAILLCLLLSAMLFAPALTKPMGSGTDIAAPAGQTPPGSLIDELHAVFLECAYKLPETIGNILIRTAALSGGYTDSCVVPLSENAVFYPYYSMLDSNAQNAYSVIYEGFLAHDETVYFAGCMLTEDRFRDVWQAVCSDHPELFWVSTECTYFTNISGSVQSAEFTYYSFPEGREEAEHRFEAAAEQILSQASGLSSDYEKERFIHDALADLTVYDSGSEYNQSAYSALVNGASVCAGYSRAFQYLMIEIGIPCYYCTGRCDGDHAWNIVMLDGEYYNVDLTWDDAISSYAFFNRSDLDFSGTHESTGMAVELPRCNGETYRSASVMPEKTPPEFRKGFVPGQPRGEPGFGGTPPGRGFRP